MGGRLEVQSKPDEGSFFFFTLQLPQSSQGQTRTPRMALPKVEHLAEGHSVYALIVDDVTTNRDVMRQMLERVGVEVESVEDGLKALESVRRRMPDIVLMDIRMPGIDGHQTMKEIVEEHGAAATKIVAVSASVFEHQQRQYEEAGFDGFIDKPVRAEVVYGTLAETLGVAFRFAAPQSTPAEPPPEESPDWSGIRLPGELARELVSAARRQSITDLNRHFTTLEALGDAEKRLAAHLQELSRKFDMNALRTAIDLVTAQ
jgi:CheY-like chemotaxis protein